VWESETNLKLRGMRIACHVVPINSAELRVSVRPRRVGSTAAICWCAESARGATQRVHRTMCANDNVFGPSPTEVVRSSASLAQTVYSQVGTA